MLSLTINSVVRGENPTLRQFEELVSEIESEDLFDGEPRRFYVNQKRIDRFIVDRTKSIARGNTVYCVYECENASEGDALVNKKLGYEISVDSNGSIVRVDKKNNPVFLDGIELLLWQKRYI